MCANIGNDISVKYPRFLYHYTSIESLGLILHNATLRFSSLQNVDDLDEVECDDIQKFGRFCYVSCWSDDEEESIPLWKMYTPDMKGVRIKLPAFPFVKYSINLIGDGKEIPFETYIDYETLEKDGKARAFQNEWRYRLFIYPLLQGWPQNNEQKKEYLLRLSNPSVPLPYSNYFLHIDRNLFLDMEIMLGPRAKTEHEIIVKALAEKYCKTMKNVCRSSLKIG